MSDYTVSRVKHGTLGAGVKDTVTLARARQVEVLNRGPVDLYFKLGAVPTVGGDDAFVVTAGGSYTVPATDYTYGYADGSVATGLVVQLIAASACAYTVTAA